MFVFQPAQSPITNVNDAMIFPSLSKRVSKETNGTMLLQKEDIVKTVERVVANMDPYTVGRCWAAHPFIVGDMLAHKGTNSFLRQSGALSFGIRKSFFELTDEHGTKTLEVIEERAVELTNTIQERLDTSGFDITTDWSVLQEDERNALQARKDGKPYWGQLPDGPGVSI